MKKKRLGKIRFLAFFLVITALLEFGLFGYYSYRVKSGDVPVELDRDFENTFQPPYRKPTPDYFPGFLLSKAFGFLALPDEIAGKISSQQFLGDYNKDLSIWRTFMPADGLLGFRPGKNVAAQHHSGYLLVTTKQGFGSNGDPDANYSKPKPKNIFRVIMLGGSTVFGDGVKNPSENLPSLVKSELSARYPGKKIELINAGVMSYTSAQEMLYLLSDLILYEPDLVIVHDGWNDQDQNNGNISHYGDEWNHMKSETYYSIDERGRQLTSLTGALQIWLEALANSIQIRAHRAWNLGVERSALLRFVTRKLLWCMRNVSSFSVKADQPFVYSPQSVRIYRDHLETMLDAAARHHFAIAFFLQPIMGVDQKKLTEREKWFEKYILDLQSREQFYMDARKMFLDFRAKSEKTGKSCISDLSNSFTDKAETLYSDSGHVGFEGNKILAHKIAENIARCGVLR